MIGKPLCKSVETRRSIGSKVFSFKWNFKWNFKWKND